jgi:hypothetical protein
VPEATVDKDGEPRASKDDVDPARDVGFWASILDKPMAAAM